MGNEDKAKYNKGNPMVSLIEFLDDGQTTLKKSGQDVFNHILIGVDVDNEGSPLHVLMGSKGGGYLKLGMIEIIEKYYAT